MSDGLAEKRAAQPAATGAILDRRSLAASHRRLAEILRPGLSVLDVGCGTGSITRGIAMAVGPTGRVVGVDVNVAFIEKARQAHGGVPGLSFEVRDIRTAPLSETFDVVTASRTLGWLADPEGMLRAMVAATRPGGIVIALEYNQDKIEWTPQPPGSMSRFYTAFRRWRGESGMDNEMADHLATLFERAGLEKLAVTEQHEIATRGEPGFAEQAGVWSDVAASRGHQLVADGAITERERSLAETEYRRWVETTAERQLMYMLAAEGTRRA